MPANVSGRTNIEWIECDFMPNRPQNDQNPTMPAMERPESSAAADAAREVATRRRGNTPLVLEDGIIQLRELGHGQAVEAGAAVYADVPTIEATRRRRSSRAARTAQAVAQSQCNAAPQLLPGLLGHDYMLRAAEISDCEKYRYWLMREWEPLLEANTRAEPSALFVMLNPSTADGIAEDATLRRCISFSKALGFKRLEVVNLFAFRATSPAELEAEYTRNGLEAACGPDNGDAIMEGLDNCRTIIAGWGERLSKGIAGERAGEFLLMTKRLGREVFCLGKTAEGHPRHPLYVRSGTGLEMFNSGALAE
jgi:hypothetical protein